MESAPLLIPSVVLSPNKLEFPRSYFVISDTIIDLFTYLLIYFTSLLTNLLMYNVLLPQNIVM